MSALAILKTPDIAPVCPPALAQNIANFDGMQIVRHQVPATVVAEAKAHLAALERYHAPPPPERIELWCRELRKSLAPIPDAEFAERLAAIQIDFADMPGWVWNSETLSLMRRRQRFFPLSCDIEEFFQPILFQKMRGLSQIRFLANATPAPPDETPEQVKQLPALIIPPSTRTDPKPMFPDVSLNGDNLAESRIARGLPDARKTIEHFCDEQVS